jgi:FixJ family two-component response regulator
VGFVIDDDAAVRIAVEGLLKSAGLTAPAFESAEEFIESGQQQRAASDLDYSCQNQFNRCDRF